MSDVLAGDLAVLLDRDLARLAAQLEAYPDDASVWRVGGTIKNSAGTLALHLVGNLEAFVGAVFGGTGYVRDREAEFADRDVPRRELLRRVAHCRESVAKGLGAVSDEAMVKAYPAPLPGPFEGWSTHRFLTHLSSHFLWHLGQIDYHRRLLAERPAD
jgi:Protein of unknown function (DUF664)